MKIVKLRVKDKLPKTKISQLTNLNPYKISKILKEKLGDKYTSRIEASPQEIKEIILLRKKRIPIKNIAEKYKIPYEKVLKVLKKELKDEYSTYLSYYRRDSSLQKSRMVRLRKRGFSIDYIMKRFKISNAPLLRILKERLGDDYQKYSCKISEDMKKRIIQLFKEHNSYEKIADLTNVSVTSIRLMLQNSFDLIFDVILSKLQWEINPDIKLGCGILYEQIRKKIRKFTKYRVASRIAPIIIFLYFRMKGLNISSKEFIKIAGLTRIEFRNGLKYIQRYFSRSFIRDHKAIITSILNELMHHFNFNPPFFHEAVQLLGKFWTLIQHTKEEIVAAVICIFTMIKLNINSPSYFTICKKLGITMSSAIYQVKHNIFERSNLSGFQGFTKSRTNIEALLRTTN